MISQVYILDHLVVRILAQLLSDKGPNLPINRDFVAVLEEDMSEFSQVCVCACVCVCMCIHTYMHHTAGGGHERVFTGPRTQNIFASDLTNQSARALTFETCCTFDI
jgi:hypothetical protein